MESEAPLLTCIACELTFTTGEEQRAHHRSEWHRWNISRRVAELPSVSLAAYEAHVAEKAAEEEAVETKRKKKEGVRVQCEDCHRAFNSVRALEQHMATRHTKVGEMKEEEMGEVTLQLTDCLFCVHHSRSLPKNLAHMTRDHSFFIPNIEYLSDLPGPIIHHIFLRKPGFLRYLTAKIELGYMCLWCNGKGKGFNSMEAVRGHMVDLSHCKLDWDDNGDEYSDFYDYSQSHAEDEGGGDEWEDMSWTSDDDLPVSGARITDGGELVLPDGKILGYREYRQQYKQNYRGQSHVERLVKGLTSEYTALGWHQPTTTLTTTRGAMRVKVGQKKEHVYHRNQKQWQKWALSVGRSANKLQHHFREAL